MPVVPSGRRLFGQGQFCQTCDEFGVVEIACQQIGFGIASAHGAIAVKAVGDTRGLA